MVKTIEAPRGFTGTSLLVAWGFCWLPWLNAPATLAPPSLNLKESSNNSIGLGVSSNNYYTFVSFGGICIYCDPATAAARFAPSAAGLVELSIHCGALPPSLPI